LDAASFAERPLQVNPKRIQIFIPVNFAAAALSVIVYGSCRLPLTLTRGAAKVVAIDNVLGAGTQ
jgi:hypothetical protein